MCNHRFHNECLQRWGDTSCPVCRYCVNTSANTSHCTVCGTSQVGFSGSPPVASKCILLQAESILKVGGRSEEQEGRRTGADAGPVDMFDLRACGLRAVPSRPCSRPLAGGRACVRAGAGVAARLGLCGRRLCAPSDPEQDGRKAGGGAVAGATLVFARHAAPVRA